MNDRLDAIEEAIEETGGVIEIDGESKSDKFLRLANYRLANAVKRIRQIKNLANKNNYDYNPEQVTSILFFLRAEVDKLEAAFQVEEDEDIPQL